MTTDDEEFDICECGHDGDDHMKRLGGNEYGPCREAGCGCEEFVPA